MKGWFAGLVAQALRRVDRRHAGRAGRRLPRGPRAGAELELAIGTGRIALPLAVRGVPVQGIDLSPEMVARLKAKPGGAEIAVWEKR